MKIRILPSASTAVAILATATISVDGFSTKTPVLSGGWRTASRYRRLVGNGESACKRMPTGRLLNQMDESSLSTDKEENEVVSDETIETTEEVVDIDGAEEEETKEEDVEADESETAAVESTGPSIYFAATEDNTTNEADDSKNKSDPEIQEGLNLETVANVAGKIAVDVFSVLRFAAANVLTKSLPDEQRNDLLGRLDASVPGMKSSAITDEAAMAAAAAEMADQKMQKERNSIQEEIAAARAEESRKSESKWEREKEEILVEMETAANARVENELKIQKMKLEEETANALIQKEIAMEAERERLEQAIQKETKRVEVLEAKEMEDAIAVDDLFAVRTDEEEARNREIEALLEKRLEDQTALESIENELIASIANEEEQRDFLQSMIEKRQSQQEKLNTIEATLKDQIKEIDAEKTRYNELVADLKAMKEQEWKNEDQQLSEDSPDEETDTDSEESEEDLVNPVLGPVIADLGYKRVHFVSSGRLGTIPVWNRNRTYRNNRAKAMAIEKAKSMELGFPGAICLHEAPNGKLSILDGQHRVGMMAALKQTFKKKNKNDEDIPDVWKDADAIFERVLVEVYPEPKKEGDETMTNNSSVFAEQVFLEINKAEPVKLIDMPGVASKADRQIITEAVEALKDEFGSMFSSSQRCRTPNVNEDNLRGMIFGANILKRHKVTTSKKLTEWLLKQNAAIGVEYENDASKQELVSKKQWTKASDNSFYLGLDSSWLYK